MSKDNTYLLDPEAQEELIRLARQGRLLTESLGLLPPNIDLLRLPSLLNEVRAPSILDLGCATGEWGLALAARYRNLHLVGLDISQRMIAYANKLAENQELAENVQFQVGNALHRLPFPDASFDLVNLRVAVGFMPRTSWEGVVRECWRVLKPRGFFISTEGEAAVTTSENPATAQIGHWLVQALWVSGLGFWDGISSSYGIHAMQPVFLKRAGFENIEHFPNFSFAGFGDPGYQGWLDNLHMIVQFTEPLITGKLGVLKEDFRAKLEESLREARMDSYRLYTTFLTVTGQKPVNI